MSLRLNVWALFGLASTSTLPPFFLEREGWRVLKEVEAATIAAAASLKFSAGDKNEI
jgi:hypothetical protein